LAGSLASSPPVHRSVNGLGAVAMRVAPLRGSAEVRLEVRYTAPVPFTLFGSGEDVGVLKNSSGSAIDDRSRIGDQSRVSMVEDQRKHLRVLIANERRDRLELLAQVVAGLGHDVIAREIYVKEVGAVTERERPDVALVGLGLSSEHALELITEIVREASCPVIALLTAKDPEYVHEAAKRGVFAYIVDGDPQELQSAIDITLQRFAEYQSLQGAFGRRALIEQAKGILMARHSVDADRAFDMLREHSQHNGRKVVDVAQAIVDSYLLLPPPLTESAAAESGR
jgi:AmiR/NasT family two-component response regulator